MQRAARMAEPRQGFWEGNLGYGHSFVTVVTALTLGLMFHVQIGYRSQWPVMSVLLFAGLPLLAITVAGRLCRANRIVHWLTGIPFAVTVTTATGLLALVGGIVPQGDLQQRFGVPSMWASWPFLMLIFLMMVNLCGSVGKRALPLNYTNVVYLMSHLGLAISIGGGAFSSLSLERNNLVLFEGRPSNVAYAADESEVHLPFRATLREFHMENFQPTLVLAERDDQAKDGVRITPGGEFVKEGAKEKIGNVQVEVLQFLPKAVLVGDEWREVPWKTAGPAALVEATVDGKKKQGWVSCGSIESSDSMLSLHENAMIAMPQPRPKKYRSQIELEDESGKRTVEIEVNKPAHIAGYDLYQVSYDEKMGAASNYSVIEVVRDRGLPGVYLGMLMMVLGSMMHLWNGMGGRK